MEGWVRSLLEQLLLLIISGIYACMCTWPNWLPKWECVRYSTNTAKDPRQVPWSCMHVSSQKFPSPMCLLHYVGYTECMFAYSIMYMICMSICFQYSKYSLAESSHQFLCSNMYTSYTVTIISSSYLYVYVLDCWIYTHVARLDIPLS